MIRTPKYGTPFSETPKSFPSAVRGAVVLPIERKHKLSLFRCVNDDDGGVELV